MNAQTTLNSAIAAGFDRLSPRDVMLCILQGAGSGGGSGTVQSVVAGAGISVNNADPANPIVSATGGGGGNGTVTGTGSPQGVVTPDFIGQLYSDQTPPGGLWEATGLTVNSWTLQLI